MRKPSAYSSLFTKKNYSGKLLTPTARVLVATAIKQKVKVSIGEKQKQ